MNKQYKQNRQIINIACEKNACYNVYHGRNIENDWQLLSEFFSSIFCKFITSIFLGYSPVLWAKSYGRLGYLIEKQIEMLIQQAVYRSSHQKCSIKNGVLKNFAKLAGKHLCKSLFFNEVAGREHLCQSLIFNKVATLKAATLLKNTLAQVFSCDFWEISKNIFSYRTPPVAPSEYNVLDKFRKLSLLT